jgi:hypothetical protein
MARVSWLFALALAPLALGLVACRGVPPSPPVPPPPLLEARVVPASDVAMCGDPNAAFTRLRALVGDWEATTASGKTVRASYRLVSNESALVETFGTSSGKETLTIFHLDGPRMLATHYCAQKNQPRLALRATPDDKRFEFAFVDATNLTDPRASHLTKLDVALLDADHFDKTEVYEEAGQVDRTVLAFRRASRP